MTVGVLIVALGAWLYAYAGYPAVLWLVARRRDRPVASPRDPAVWPSVSIVIPVYNEAAVIAGTLADALALDYPAERRQILVVSDASSDDTETIVGTFADRGVELVRQLARAGKTAAEAAAGIHVRGDIVVTMDAATRLPPAALKALIRPFQDPAVGVVSGRDVSVAPGASLGPPAANQGEAAYVSYEMWVRDLETRVYGIVGASGCFFAIRADLYRLPLPGGLSRDFAAALRAREHGFRSLAASQAVCYVSRSSSLAQEYRRKVRTMARGLATLWHLRSLLDPRRYGAFAWMLWSHKVSRWVLPWTIPVVLIALAQAAPDAPWARWGFGLAAAGLVLGGMAWLGVVWLPWARWRGATLAAYVVLGTTAALHAWGRALRGSTLQAWEPTRREG